MKAMLTAAVVMALASAAPSTPAFHGIDLTSEERHDPACLDQALAKSQEVEGMDDALCVVPETDLRSAMASLSERAKAAGWKATEPPSDLIDPILFERNAERLLLSPYSERFVELQSKFADAVFKRGACTQRQNGVEPDFCTKSDALLAGMKSEAEKFKQEGFSSPILLIYGSKGLQ